MKLEKTYFVAMDKKTSLFLVNKYGSLSKLPSQAKAFATVEQAEECYKRVYDIWANNEGYGNDYLRSKEIDFEVLQMRESYELLPKKQLPF